MFSKIASLVGAQQSEAAAPLLNARRQDRAPARQPSAGADPLRLKALSSQEPAYWPPAASGSAQRTEVLRPQTPPPTRVTTPATVEPLSWSKTVEIGQDIEEFLNATPKKLTALKSQCFENPILLKAIDSAVGAINNANQRWLHDLVKYNAETFGKEIDVQLKEIANVSAVFTAQSKNQSSQTRIQGLQSINKLWQEVNSKRESKDFQFILHLLQTTTAAERASMRSHEWAQHPDNPARASGQR